MSNSSIWPIDWTLSDATTPGQSGHESDGNKGVLCIFPNSCNSVALPSDCLMSYPWHSLLGGVSYIFVEMQLVYGNVSVFNLVQNNPHLEKIKNNKVDKL